MSVFLTSKTLLAAITSSFILFFTHTYVGADEYSSIETNPTNNEPDDNADYSVRGSSTTSINALKHRFGMGVQVGGETGIYGVQASIFLRQDLSLQMGIGTGYDYSSTGIGLNYYFLGSFVRPFFKIAGAHWYSKYAPQPKEKLFPLFLPFNLYRDQENQPLNLFAFFPALGLQIELDNGIKINTEIMSVLAPFLANGPKTALHLAFGFLFFF